MSHRHAERTGQAVHAAGSDKGGRAPLGSSTRDAHHASAAEMSFAAETNRVSSTSTRSRSVSAHARRSAQSHTEWRGVPSLP